MSSSMLTKRIFDAVAAMLLAVVLSPMMAVIAVAVKADSPGEVFFRQTRLGHRGRRFSIIKFRTMAQGAEQQGLETYESDPRITRVGRVLRKYHLDELPQLLNVIAGDMSLVGPRPLLPQFLGAYTDHERRRLDVPQGMTGWQQVIAGARSTWDERIELDVWYVEHRTLWLDILILLRTPLVVLRADRVYGEDGRQISGIPCGDPERAREEIAS